MLLNEIVRRLRDGNTVFEDRIAGAYSINEVQENQNLEIPSAFVIPVTEAARRPSGVENDICQQEVIRTFQVLAVLDATCDPRSQEPSDAQEAARDSLFSSLLTWRPNKNFGQTYYLSMIAGGSDGSRALFGFNFNFTEYLNYECYQQSQFMEESKISTLRAGIKTGGTQIASITKRK